MLYSCFLLIIVLQRGIELRIAQKNEITLKKQGALEFGQKHYPYIVIIHLLFFISLSIEVYVFQKQISPVWPFLLVLFIFAQIGRGWAIRSLKEFWNTKIIVLPRAEVIQKGPYRFIKHPNYVIVILEFLTIPLLFSAYFTAFLFSFLNLLLLSVRIQVEEQALNELTEYETLFRPTKRFIPKFIKKS